MDIDFSLVLVILVFITGVIWLFDHLFLLSGRKTAVGNYQTGQGPLSNLVDQLPINDLEQLAALEIEDKDRIAIAKLAKEPLLVEYAKSFFPVLFIVLILRSFVVEPFTIPSSSMLPTLEIGDYILVNKFNYGLRLPVIGTKIVANNDPQRGDIMVFKYPGNPSINYIKRVVGVPGDKVRYEDKKLYINGEEIKPRFIAKVPPRSPTTIIYDETLGDVTHSIQHMVGRKPSLELQQTTIPDNQYFVMGDNRDNSNDSRAWGMVEDKYVVGKAFAIWMNKAPGLHLPSFSRNGGIN